MSRTVKIADVIKGAKAFLPHLNEERVMRAYEFARKAHEGQKRASGEPYILHPLSVAYILLQLKPDEDSIVAALLHDVLEDTDTEIDAMRKEFGESVVPLLKGMEKLGKVYYRGRERQVENLRKMFLAMAKDIRVILVKLCDRLHNMRTLEHVPEAKRRRIAEETLSVYAPIAGRLGIYEIKGELEDLCFQYLYPDDYERIIKEMQEATGEQKNIINSSRRILMQALKKAGIKATVEGRIKHLYSIFKKLKRKDKNYISELYDVLALRIVVDSESNCYQALGVVHKHWTPLSRRFKDYIAVPKANGYQSLHTTLIGLCPNIRSQPIEIQIRSEDMDSVARYGIAAHWQYKEEGSRSIAVPEEKLTWVKNLVSLHESLQSNTEFIESLSTDIFHDRIFVLTPKGDVFDLPNGATPVDFAYAIHTDLGDHCKGAKVNGVIVPLTYKLKNGEVVEIQVSQNTHPNHYWLSFVVTSHAKTRIKQWINSQDRDKVLKIGKEIINNHLKRFGQPGLDPTLTLLKNYNGEKLSLRDREFLVEKIGNGSVDALTVVKKLLPEDKAFKKAEEAEVKREALTEGVTLEARPEVLITGEKGYKTQIASCCQPTTEQDIIGYITRGAGVTIHRKDCKVLRGHETERLIKASWSTNKHHEFVAKIELRRRSRIGLLRDVADVFASNGLPILDIHNIRHDGTDVGEMVMTSSMDSLDTLNLVMHQLESIPGVFEVREID